MRMEFRLRDLGQTGFKNYNCTYFLQRNARCIYEYSYGNTFLVFLH